jgi:hypothetical protein
MLFYILYLNFTLASTDIYSFHQDWAFVGTVSRALRGGLYTKFSYCRSMLKLKRVRTNRRSGASNDSQFFKLDVDIW